jgi:hypothetical protein
VFSGKATKTNFIDLGLTQLGLKPMISSTQGKHTNHYTIDAICLILRFYLSTKAEFNDRS